MILMSLLVGLGVFAVLLCGEALVHRFRRHPRPLHRAARHWHIHLVPATVAAVFLSGLVIALLIPRSYGAIQSRHLPRIVPHPHAVPLSGGGVSVAWTVPVLDQGQSNACGSFATLVSLEIEERLRGEAVPVPLSPWYQYQFASGCTDQPTTMDEQYAAYSGHGQATLAAVPAYTCPGDWTAAREKGGRYYWTFTENTGSQAVGLALADELAAGHVPVLLVTVYSGMTAAYGAATTDNAGVYEGRHWLPAVGWRYDAAHHVEILIQNSWGTLWGTGGYIWLTQAALRPDAVLAAAVVLPGAAQWPTPRPPKPHPPAHQTGWTYKVTTAAYLRGGPRDAARQRHLVPKGALVRYGWYATPHWRYVCQGQDCGWIRRDHLG